MPKNSPTDETNPTPLGDWLRRERAARSLSLRDLRSATGVPFATIIDIEKGKRNPSFRTLVRILRTFGETRETLVSLYGDALHTAAESPEWTAAPPTFEALGELLRRARQERGLSREDFARQIGRRSTSASYAIENGTTHRWTIGQALRVGQALGVADRLLAFLWEIYAPTVSVKPLPLKPQPRKLEIVAVATFPFGAWLVHERERRGLSQEALQKVSGVSIGTLSRIEHDKCQLSVRTTVRILQGLGIGEVEFLQLFGVSGDEYPGERAHPSLPEIGAFIRSTRQAQRVQAKELARAVQISWSTLHQIEKGTGLNCKMLLALKIGQALGVTGRLLSMLWDAYAA